MRRRVRRAVSATVLASVLGGPAPARAQTADAWFGADKALHFSVSAVLAGTGYGGAALFTDRTAVRLGAGAGLALSLGVVKEALDAAGAGNPSWRDLTWDVLGTGVGVLASWLIDELVRSLDPPRPARAR